ncbi:Uncharacterised protein g2956 [Pycnogonum litorale]
MKQMARRYRWCPRIDNDIEETVRACYTCQEFAKIPPKATKLEWSWPTGPWKRLHLDFAGPFLNKSFLVLVDAYSKYLDVIPMNKITSTETINALRHVFSVFGLPEHIVTDNGTAFTSEVFKHFLSMNDIQHTLTPPGHPATNGLAERYVGYFNDKMKKLGKEDDSITSKLDRFLFSHRTTPTSMGKSPGELLMNRQPRIRFDALRKSRLSDKLKLFQDNENSPKFSNNQSVFARNFGKGNK